MSPHSAPMFQYLSLPFPTGSLLPTASPMMGMGHESPWLVLRPWRGIERLRHIRWQVSLQGMVDTSLGLEFHVGVWLGCDTVGPTETQWIVRDPRAKDSLFATVTYCGQPMLGLKARNIPTRKLPVPAYLSSQHSALGDHTEAPSGLKAAPMLAPWLFKIHTARDTHWISEIRPSNHMYVPENSRNWAYFFLLQFKRTPEKVLFLFTLKGHE